LLKAKLDKLNGSPAPDCALDGLNEIRLTGLERMAGTTDSNLRPAVEGPASSVADSLAVKYNCAKPYE